MWILSPAVAHNNHYVSSLVYNHYRAALEGYFAIHIGHHLRLRFVHGILVHPFACFNYIMEKVYYLASSTNSPSFRTIIPCLGRSKVICGIIAQKE